MGPNYENRLTKGQPYITSETLQSEVSRWIFLPLRMVGVPNQAGYFETQAPLLHPVISLFRRYFPSNFSPEVQRQSALLFWYLHLKAIKERFDQAKVRMLNV